MEFVCSTDLIFRSVRKKKKTSSTFEYFPGCFIILFQKLEFDQNIKSPITDGDFSFLIFNVSEMKRYENFILLL